MTADASFAIPLEQVLYIEKDVKRNLQVNELDGFNHKVITFQNNSVQLYDFNQLKGAYDAPYQCEYLATKDASQCHNGPYALWLPEHCIHQSEKYSRPVPRQHHLPIHHLPSAVAYPHHLKQ